MRRGLKAGIAGLATAAVVATGTTLGVGMLAHPNEVNRVSKVSFQEPRPPCPWIIVQVVSLRAQNLSYVQIAAYLGLRVAQVVAYLQESSQYANC